MFENGIRKVTIGSDAHFITQLGKDFQEATLLLKKVGYKEICVFEKRKPRYLKHFSRFF